MHMIVLALLGFTAISGTCARGPGSRAWRHCQCEELGAESSSKKKELGADAEPVVGDLGKHGALTARSLERRHLRLAREHLDVAREPPLLKAAARAGDGGRTA